MNERTDDQTPEPIKDLFQGAYTAVVTKLREKLGDLSNYTAIDCACGNFEHRNYLERNFFQVAGIDLQSSAAEYRVDLTQPEVLRKFNPHVFLSLETLEHLDIESQRRLVDILDKGSQVATVFGSINLNGPDHIAGYEIWKREKNPYHIHEHDLGSWKELFPENDGWEIYGNVADDGVWTLLPLTFENQYNAYSLYAIKVK